MGIGGANSTLEARGEAAISRVDTRVERIEQVMGSMRDQINFLERKIDRLELLEQKKE